MVSAQLVAKLMAAGNNTASGFARLSGSQWPCFVFALLQSNLNWHRVAGNGNSILEKLLPKV